jgi:hypothetical protein
MLVLTVSVTQLGKEDRRGSAIESAQLRRRTGRRNRSEQPKPIYHGSRHGLGGGSLVISNDHYGARGVPYALLANGAEQHPGKGFPTAASHDQHVSVPRGLQEHRCLAARYDLGSNFDLLVIAEGLKYGPIERLAGAGGWVGARGKVEHDPKRRAVLRKCPCRDDVERGPRHLCPSCRPPEGLQRPLRPVHPTTILDPELDASMDLISACPPSRWDDHQIGEMRGWAALSKHSDPHDDPVQAHHDHERCSNRLNMADVVNEHARRIGLPSQYLNRGAV